MHVCKRRVGLIKRAGCRRHGFERRQIRGTRGRGSASPRIGPERPIHLSPGRKPWVSTAGTPSPRGGTKDVRMEYDERGVRVRRRGNVSSFQDYSSRLARNPGLTPWARMCRPFRPFTRAGCGCHGFECTHSNPCLVASGAWDLLNARVAGGTDLRTAANPRPPAAVVRRHAPGEGAAQGCAHGMR